MFAVNAVDAPLRQGQAFHRLSAQQVRLHDFIHVGRSDSAVPDRVGIDHNRGAVLALVKTSRLVRAHILRQAVLRQLLFEESMQIDRSLRIATAARMLWCALVGAYEDVSGEPGHAAQCIGTLACEGREAEKLVVEWDDGLIAAAECGHAPQASIRSRYRDYRAGAEDGVARLRHVPLSAPGASSRCNGVVR